MLRSAIIFTLCVGALPVAAQEPSSGDANPAAAQAENDALRALSDGTNLRADDIARLDQLNLGVGSSVMSAIAGASAEERRILVDGLSGTALPAEAARPLLAGDWSCRTVKIGLGTLPIVVYEPFTCRVSADGTFEKLTGSQRTKGKIGEWQGGLVYAGTGFVAGETPIPYADQDEDVDPARVPQMMPQVGRVEMTAPDAGRILFPRPYLESELDLLILRR